MASQLLVNVITVAVPAFQNILVEHGLKSGGKPVPPTLIISVGASPLYVGDVTSTTARVYNPTPTTQYAQFRFERGYSTELDSETVEPFFYAGSSPSFLPKFYSTVGGRREGTVTGNFGASTSVDITPEIGGSGFTLPIGDYITMNSLRLVSGYVQNSTAGLRRVSVSLFATVGSGTASLASREIVVPANSIVNIPDLNNSYVYARPTPETYSNVRMNLTLRDGVSASVSYSVYDMNLRVITSQAT